MNIAACLPVSLSDYPGKPAAVVFTRGCNFCCPYCHNPELVPRVNNQKKPAVPVEALMDFLEARKGKLQALVVGGGEPTLQDGLLSFMRRVKTFGYKVKLDTNGSRPGVLLAALNQELVDYIAMDIKGPLEKYPEIVGRPVPAESIRFSVRLLIESSTDYEFRTTVVKSLLTPEDLETCACLIAGAKRYYLQRFVPTSVLEPSYRREQTYSPGEFVQIRERLRKYVPRCEVR